MPVRRILTSHAGSLPRPPALTELHGKMFRGEAGDAALLEREIDAATQTAVRMQAQAGIDIANDGEQARESFFTYVQHRMTGFGGIGTRPPIRDVLTIRWRAALAGQSNIQHASVAHAIFDLAPSRRGGGSRPSFHVGVVRIQHAQSPTTAKGAGARLGSPGSDSPPCQRGRGVQ
ncbi:MAG: hypothetical protein HYX53_16130 [Chloroflexi bacterium]|nr:hypothetical protein [Chloroflexota bacterium]